MSKSIFRGTESIYMVEKTTEKNISGECADDSASGNTRWYCLFLWADRNRRIKRSNIWDNRSWNIRGNSDLFFNTMAEKCTVGNGMV